VEPAALHEHLFRHEAGRVTAALTRIFGTHNLALAEDVVQDAFARALEVWKFQGPPPNPAAWLMTTARNRAPLRGLTVVVWLRLGDRMRRLAYLRPPRHRTEPLSSRAACGETKCNSQRLSNRRAEMFAWFHGGR
jgi:hypothetical protein